MQKPFLLALALFGFAAGPALSATRVAPADEYFGRLNLSVLGIANTIKDMRLRVEADRSKSPSIFGSLEFVEDALHDWEHKFPSDSWIPKDLFALETCYLAAAGEPAREFAARTEAWLQRDFPRSPYAHEGHEALARAGVASVALPSYAIQTAVGSSRPATSSSGYGPPVTTVPAAAP